MSALELKRSFGFHGPIRGNAFLVEDEESSRVIFPVGSRVVSYDSRDGDVFFFEIGHVGIQAVTSLALSCNQKYLAVCAQFGDGARALVFNVSSRRHVRTITTTGGKIVSACFSGDAKQLICAARESVSVWTWMDGKLELSTALVQGEVSKVCCPHFSTSSSPFISSSGPGHFRVWTAVNSHDHLKQTMVMPPQSKEKKCVVFDHAWLRRDKQDGGPHRLAAILDARDGGGKVVIFQLYDEDSQRFTLEVEHTIELDLETKVNILSISAFDSKCGFCLGGSSGFFSAYELTQERQGESSFSNLVTCYNGEQEAYSNISIAPDDERIILFSEANRIQTCSLLDGNHVAFSDVLPCGHRGSILHSSYAVQKPIYLTCGADCTVRVWNYNTGNCDVVKSFHQEKEPVSVSVHPAGFQVLIGFADRIGLYNLLAQDMTLFAEMSCKPSCRRLQYSHGGQYFAVALGSTLNVYSSYPKSKTAFELLHCFNGHAGHIASLQWSSTDTAIYTTGMDGSVYGWDLVGSERMDHLNVFPRSTHYTSLAVGKGKAAACGADGHLYVSSWSGSETDMPIVNRVSRGSSPTERITTMHLVADEQTLFVGTAGGSLRLYQWPVMHENPSYRESSAHAAAVTCVHRTAEGNYISAAQDGSIFVSALCATREEGLEREQADAPVEIDSKPCFNDEVLLVNADEYNECKQRIVELESQMTAMKSDHEFALHSKDSEWQNEIKELSEKTDELIEGERARFNELQQKHEETIQRHVEDLEEIDRIHSAKVAELENHYEHRLAVGMQRLDRLSQEMKAAQAKCEERLKGQDELHEQKMWSIGQNAEKMEKKLNTTIATLREELLEQQRIYKETLDQQEEEYEMELLSLKTAAECQLHQEHDKMHKMRGAMQNVNSQKDQLSRHNQDLKANAQLLEEAHSEEKARRLELERELGNEKESLKQKDETIRQERRVVSETKNEKNILSNLRSVLEHEVRELKEERGPVQESIDGLKREIVSLRSDLGRERKAICDKGLELEQKDLKIKSQERQMSSDREKLRQRDRELLSIQADFASIVELHSDKDIREAIKLAYKKHVRGETCHRGATSKLSSRKGNEKAGR